MKLTGLGLNLNLNLPQEFSKACILFSAKDNIVPHMSPSE